MANEDATLPKIQVRGVYTVCQYGSLGGALNLLIDARKDIQEEATNLDHYRSL